MIAPSVSLALYMIGQEGAVRKESRARIRPRYSVVLSCAARPDLPALPGSSEDRVKEGDSLLSGAVLARLLCAFSKKLAEKLDAVRQAAGDSLNWDRHPAKNEIKAR
jgi:hypothetical protein